MMVFISCLYQFDPAARIVRGSLGSILEQLHFINDKVAFFNIPALEIDTEVNGLMVIRGVTISLSHLSIVAHGVEVGIKLSDDMEIALQVDKVSISLFRRIQVGEVFGNLKGGEFEMTFGNLAKVRDGVEGTSLMVADTPLLLAAAKDGNTTRADTVTTTEKMTAGSRPKDVSAEDGFASLTQISPNEEKARSKYSNALKYIEETSAIGESRMQVAAMAQDDPNQDDKTFNPQDRNDMRAAICSQLHDKPSVPHPPHRSIKVTTLRNLSPPYVRRFLHRLPFMLRLLLNPLAYFHPIYIDSITAGGSGKWLHHLLHEMIFKDYADNDAGIRKLEKRISDWLSDANFVLQIANIVGTAQVPLDTSFDVTTQMRLDDVMAYRTLPLEIDLKKVVRLGGADASITIPSFLLPHHEHILPERPTEQTRIDKEKEVAEADGKPKTVQAQRDLEQTKNDETNLTVSVHARLPAVFDQEVLDFVAALVKATKIIEMEHGLDHTDTVDILVEEEAKRGFEEPKRSFEETRRNLEETKRGFKEMTKAFRTNVRDSVKRVAVDAVTNDRWIAKMVGKVTKRLEVAKGDIGYSGIVPVPLEPYRQLAEKAATKLLP